MKKMILISAVAVIICSVISISASSLTQMKEDAVKEAEKSVVQEKPQVYIVREYKGLVAVFTEDSDMPQRLTDTIVYSLPDYDVEKLQAGITVEGKENLEKLLMDFCS